MYNISSYRVVSDEEKKEQNLLPLSVKILTKIENLNSDKVIFNSSYDVSEYHYVELDLNEEEVTEYKKSTLNNSMWEYNLDLAQKLENNLSELAIEKINNEIGTSNVIFDTGRLVKSIELVDNKTDSPKIRLKLRYTIKNN